MKTTLLCLCCLATTFLHAEPRPLYIEGEVIVRYKNGGKFTRRFPALRQPTGLLRVPGKTTADLLDQLRRDPNVAHVEPNYLRWFTAVAPTNDPSFPQLWGLRNTGQAVNGTTGTAGADIQFADAWCQATLGTATVVVAVLDSGLDTTHPDLVDNLWINPGETPGNHADDDANGYTDDIHGYDFTGQTGALTDSGKHGTHVSGTIAATGNNQLGVIGVNFQARLMGLRVSADGLAISSAAVIEALQYATLMKTRGVNIVALNGSFGGPGHSVGESDAIAAAGEAGIIFVAAAGNNGANNDLIPTYPANYRLPNMIVVAASDQHDDLAGFSNYGATSVDIAAPGVNILSTVPVSLAGTTAAVTRAGLSYSALGLEYSGFTTGLTASVIDCALGKTFDFPPSVAGKIALIERGQLFFSEKVQNAMNAGAAGVIIYNNTNGNFSGSLQIAGNWIPAVSISREDGLALLAALPATVKMSIVTDSTQIYRYLEGTSMATPHVCGAVAFAAMNAPGETVAQRIQRILNNADFVPGLVTKVATAGRLNLQRVFAGTPLSITSEVVAQIAGVSVVLPNQPVTFAGSITNFTGATGACAWDFGDGATSSDCGPSHTFTDCGVPVVRSMAAATDGSTLTNTFPVAVACPIGGLSLSMKTSFVPGKLESAKLKGTVELPAGYDPTGRLIYLQVGSVVLPFTLDVKGGGVTGASKFKSKRNGPALTPGKETWSISASLKGDWNSAWIADGLVNATVTQMIEVPVTCYFSGPEAAVAFESKAMLYRGLLGVSGSAK